eukprot:2425236-Rhodomonas_salina.1
MATSTAHPSTTMYVRSSDPSCPTTTRPECESSVSTTGLGPDTSAETCITDVIPYCAPPQTTTSATPSEARGSREARDPVDLGNINPKFQTRTPVHLSPNPNP